MPTQIKIYSFFSRTSTMLCPGDNLQTIGIILLFHWFRRNSAGLDKYFVDRVRTMDLDSQVVSHFTNMFEKFSDHFLQVAFLLGLYEVQLLWLFLLYHFPFQNSVSVQISVWTAMCVEKERIGRFQWLELEIPVFHPEPIFEHLVKNDIPLDKGLNCFIDNILAFFLFGLFELIIWNPEDLHIFSFTLTHPIMKVYAHTFVLEFVVYFAE